ncbi:hypothetical protein [Sulfuricurvum sp.]|uniref:rolling circle replication-associated protein n=1 Tax=Sulfuricurvum sp. TaxID=2025608 RepID=UPI00356494B9
MTKYAITPHDLKYCREKINGQRSYLSNNHFSTSTGQVKSLLDVSFSANISERYYSQLSNKINTMHSLSISQSLKPVFLTITLDGFFRGFLTANYRKWHRLTDVEKFQYLKHIPNNEVHGYLHDKINSESKFTIKDCYNVLAYQWYRYSSGYSFKKIKKDAKQFMYLKAAEPHKDGVPHFHVLLWIPQGYFETFKKDFERYFPAPQNHVPIKDGNEGDTKGFQTAIHNPVGYIMKYATKSFMDLRTGEDLNHLQAWYVKHKIRRITTSHSTVPQWVYQKVFALEKDWYHLTDLTIREPMLCEWNKEDDYFILMEDNGRVLEYDQGLLTLRYIDGPILKQLGEKSDRPKTQPRIMERVPLKWVNQHLKPFIPVYIDQKYFIFKNNQLLSPKPQPMKMKNYALVNYYNEIDVETVNPHHYAHVRNEMIKRNLIDGEIIPLDQNTKSEMWGYSEYDL